jgi:hypothetical protein
MEIIQALLQGFVFGIIAMLTAYFVLQLAQLLRILGGK